MNGVESLCTLWHETFSNEIGMQKIAKCKSSADTRGRIISSLLGNVFKQYGIPYLCSPSMV